MAVVENNQVEQNNVDQSKSRSIDQQKNMTTNGNNRHQHEMAMNGVDHDHEEEGFKKETRDLAEMLSKLNLMAAEFVPSSLSNNLVLVPPSPTAPFVYACIHNFLLQTNNTLFTDGSSDVRRVYTLFLISIHLDCFVRILLVLGSLFRVLLRLLMVKRRMNSRSSMAQREDVIKRTVYVTDIDHQVTEEQLAALYINRGQSSQTRVFQ